MQKNNKLDGNATQNLPKGDALNLPKGDALSLPTSTSLNLPKGDALSLPKGWKYGVLGDAVEKGSSNISLNKLKNDEGEYPLFSAKGFAKKISFFHQEKEYLGIIKDGAGIGRVSKHPAKSSIVATMQYLVPKEGFDIGFVEYFLNGIDFKKHRSGSTIPHIYFKDYKNEPFPILPLPEQQRIVGKLDALFAGIEALETNTKQNLENAKELFQSYLQGVFDPSTHRDDDCGTLSSSKWEEKKLGDLCKTGAGGTPLKNNKEYYKNGNIPWLRSGEVCKKNITECKLYISEQGLNNSSAKLFPPNTVLVAMYGATAGQVGVLRFESSTNQAVCGIYPNDNFIPEFLYYKFLEGKEALVKQAVGGAQPNISQIKIKNTLIPNLPLSEQQRIVAKLDALSAETKKLESIYQEKLLFLSELKKSILDRAFKGKLL